jgi:hypothetical protein
MKALPIFLLGVLCLQRHLPAASIDFESLSDSEIVTTQFPGLTFHNAIALTSGISLNEFEFPPSSGVTVLSDNGGPITIDFSGPISSFSAAFTYLYNVGCVGLGCGGVRIEFYDAANILQLVAASLFQSNAALSGDPGSSPNEIIGSSLLSGLGITKVVITGDPLGGSFALDDLSYTSTAVPEPTTFILAAAGLIAAFTQRRNKNK